MSDHVVQSYHDGNGRDGQPMQHSYQSVWMAHWSQTSCKETPRVHNHLSRSLESKDDLDSSKRHLLSGLEVASDISPSAKGFTQVMEARRTGPTSTKNVINEGLDCQPFPMFRLFQDAKNDVDDPCHRQVSRPQIDCNVEYSARTTLFPPVLAVAPAATETSLRECLSKQVAPTPEGLVNFPKSAGDSILAVAGPSQDNFTGSTQIVPYRFKRGKTQASSSFMSRQEEQNQLSSVLVSKEHLPNANFAALGDEPDNYHVRSALLVCEKKLDNRTSVKSGTSVLRESNASVLRESNASQLLKDSYAGNYNLPMLVEERFQKIQNCSGTGFFTSCSIPPVTMKSEKLYHECVSLQRIPGSIHDVETMRIYTKKSVEELAGGPGALSQTTQNLLVMKKTDVNLSKENQAFSESRDSSKLKRNLFGGLLSLSPPLSQEQQRLKPQPLGISAESKGKDKIEGAETSGIHLKNESSAETDTMDTDAFKEQNYLSGVNSSPSNMDILTGQKPPSSSKIASAGEEVGLRWSIPDMNEEIPALPTASSSLDKAEPSTSRTQSLDAEHLLSHAEMLSKSKSSPCQDGPPRLEPSSRWLKRLKLSASDSFALGTKSSNLGEVSSHEKVNKLFSKIAEGSKTSSSEPMLRKQHSKEEMATDQNAIVLRNDKSSSMESAKKGQDTLLSHPWIQRWCHSRATAHQKKPEAVVVCEPESTKVEFNELQNKQFPSIAAMALMGKAMTGFQPCEIRRSGAFIVWNNKGF